MHSCIPLPRSSRLRRPLPQYHRFKKKLLKSSDVDFGWCDYVFLVRYKISYWSFWVPEDYSRESMKRNRIVIIGVLSLMGNTANNCRPSMPSGLMLFLEFWWRDIHGSAVVSSNLNRFGDGYYRVFQMFSYHIVSEIPGGRRCFPMLNLYIPYNQWFVRSPYLIYRTDFIRFHTFTTLRCFTNSSNNTIGNMFHC